MPNSPEYPLAVKVTIAYLKAVLPAAGQAVLVVHDIPTQRPAKFVRVSRTGGVEIFHRVLDGAQITVDCWAADAADAEKLAAVVRRLIHDMAGTVQSGAAVHKVDEIGGPSDLPDDPASGSPRFTLTLQIQMRGVAA